MLEHCLRLPRGHTLTARIIPRATVKIKGTGEQPNLPGYITEPTKFRLILDGRPSWKRVVEDGVASREDVVDINVEPHIGSWRNGFGWARISVPITAELQVVDPAGYDLQYGVNMAVGDGVFEYDVVVPGIGEAHISRPQSLTSRASDQLAIVRPHFPKIEVGYV